MYLESDLALGAMAPSSSPSLVNGVQQLDPGTASGMLAYLADKYFIPDPLQPTSGGASNFVSVTGQALLNQGVQLEGQPTAAQQIQSIPSGQVAVANLDDVQAVAAGQPPANGFHVTVSDAASAAGFAKQGSSFAVLWPLGSSIGTTETPKKSMVVPIVLAVAGAGVGALVGGGVGAAIGGVGGYLVGSAAA